MRTTKQLLKLVLKHGNRDFDNSYGISICNFITHNLRPRKIISDDEYEILIDFIRQNRPTPDSPHFCKKRQFSFFYWDVCDWTPRKLWLEDQIKSL